MGLASLNLLELTLGSGATVKVRLWPGSEPRRWPAQERDAQGAGVMEVLPGAAGQRDD